MTEIVLGVDQGTSSTRCLAFDVELRERGSAAVAVSAAFPGPGLVEQDPDGLLASVRTAVSGAVAQAGCRPDDVVAVGIANQTETFVVYERESGRAIHPAIVWQDRRTADVCASLASRSIASGGAAGVLVRARTGLELDATFPASKVAWVLDGIPDARARASAGELAYADVAGWVLRGLSGVSVCEASNAGRTLLCPLGGADWDDELLELFEVPRALMPPIVDSDRVGALGADGELPVRAMLGDQQASLFGLGCHAVGRAKVTLGTGAFILGQAGSRAPSPPDGVLASCAWRRRGETSYALEGFIPTAGAAIDWFAGLGVLPRGDELDALLQEGSGGDDAAAGAAVCVAALQGLGTPSWDAAARGAIFGLSRATSRAELARAIVDGVLHQVADAVTAIGAEMPLTEVLLDGGMAHSGWIVQRLADLAGVRVARSARPEATATGAAMLAGLAAGVWGDVDELPPLATDLVCEPSLPESHRGRLREQWAQAVALSGQWG